MKHLASGMIGLILTTSLLFVSVGRADPAPLAAPTTPVVTTGVFQDTAALTAATVPVVPAGDPVSPAGPTKPPVAHTNEPGGGCPGC